MGGGPHSLRSCLSTPKGQAGAALLAADPSGGGFLPKEVDKNFLVGVFSDRRVYLDVLGCVRSFAHVFRKKFRILRNIFRF